MLSAFSKPVPSRRNSLPPGKADRAAIAFGKSHRRQRRHLLTVLHIRLAPWLAGSSHFIQLQRTGESKGRKDLGSPPRLVLNTLAIFIISQFLAAFLVGSTAALLNANSAQLNFADQPPVFQFCYILIAEGLAIGLVYRIIKKRGLTLSFIGLGRRPVWSDLWNGMAGFAVFFGLLILASSLLAWLVPGFKTDQPQEVGFNNLNTTLDSLIAFMALVLLPPLGEEVLMRGYLYSGLRARWRFLPAMILTSLLFGVAHLQFGSSAPLVWGAAINTFILSVVLVFLRERTGVLYAGIAVHILNNLIAFGVHFL